MAIMEAEDNLLKSFSERVSIFTIIWKRNRIYDGYRPHWNTFSSVVSYSVGIIFKVFSQEKVSSAEINRT